MAGFSFGTKSRSESESESSGLGSENLRHEFSSPVDFFLQGAKSESESDLQTEGSGSEPDATSIIEPSVSSSHKSDVARLAKFALFRASCRPASVCGMFGAHGCETRIKPSSICSPIKASEN